MISSQEPSCCMFTNLISRPCREGSIVAYFREEGFKSPDPFSYKHGIQTVRFLWWKITPTSITLGSSYTFMSCISYAPSIYALIRELFNFAMPNIEY